MKKQLLALAVASTFATSAYAAMPVGSFGAATTLGQTASPVTINSTRFNPAAGYLVIDHEDGEKVRFGYWSQLGFGMEFGQADNFQEDVDRLQDALDDLDASPSASKAIKVREDFDDLLVNFGDNGNMKVTGAVSVPGMPFAIAAPKIGGVVTLDAAYTIMADISFLDDPLVDVSGTLRTNSAVYVKGVNIFQLGAGYSRPVFELKGNSPLKGELVVGVRGNLYFASMTKQVANIDRDDGKDVGDLISDGLDENSKDTTAFGLDVGAVWLSDLYQVGLTVKNLNSPELEYGSLDNNASARYFSGELDMNETHTMDPQFTVDGAVFTKSKAVMLSGSMDMNEVNDAVGDQVQNLHVAATYFPKHPIAPILRAGYQKNLAGSELSALNLGLGLFRGVASLDVTYGLETVEVDGSEVPRQFGLQFSFEESF